MLIRFSKMHSLGNDFVVIDAVRQRLELGGDLARHLAERRTGIGCDQVLLAEASSEEDVEYLFRIFNADGSEAAQCGNGARCFARFLERERLSQSSAIRVATSKSKMTLHLLDDGRVRVDMGAPVFEPGAIPFTAASGDHVHTICAGNDPFEFGVLSMGNPHAVTIVEDVQRADVAGIGPRIERHELFPERTNVGFMQIVNRSEIRLRVFERGAGETRACGSGACAAVVSGRLRGLLDEQVTVNLPGGRVEVAWRGVGEPVFLSGDAIHVYDGEIEICEP